MKREILVFSLFILLLITQKVSADLLFVVDEYGNVIIDEDTKNGISSSVVNNTIFVNTTITSNISIFLSINGTEFYNVLCKDTINCSLTILPLNKNIDLFIYAVVDREGVKNRLPKNGYFVLSLSPKTIVDIVEDNITVYAGTDVVLTIIFKNIFNEKGVLNYNITSLGSLLDESSLELEKDSAILKHIKMSTGLEEKYICVFANITTNNYFFQDYDCVRIKGVLPFELGIDIYFPLLLLSLLLFIFNTFNKSSNRI